MRLSSYIGGIFCALMASANAQASTMTSNCVDPNYCKLSELYDGGSLSYAGLSFGSFKRTSLQSEALDEAGATISARKSAAGLQLEFDFDPAIRLSDPVEAFFEFTYGLSFDVSTDIPGFALTASLLQLESATIGGDATIEVNASASDGAKLNTFRSAYSAYPKTLDYAGLSSMSSSTFDVDIFGEGFGSSVARLSSFGLEFRYAPVAAANRAAVPLPGSALLFATSLLCLAAFRALPGLRPRRASS